MDKASALAAELESKITPWGSWRVLEDAPDHKVKRLDVNPGHRLSYQKHQKRSERWTVVYGTATVILDGKEIELKEGETIFIPRQALHRIWNKGEETVTIIEVQIGEYFGEDDIIRVEDDYKRE